MVLSIQSIIPAPRQKLILFICFIIRFSFFGCSMRKQLKAVNFYVTPRFNIVIINMVLLSVYVQLKLWWYQLDCRSWLRIYWSTVEGLFGLFGFYSFDVSCWVVSWIAVGFYCFFLYIRFCVVCDRVSFSLLVIIGVAWFFVMFRMLLSSIVELVVGWKSYRMRRYLPDLCVFGDILL